MVAQSSGTSGSCVAASLSTEVFEELVVLLKQVK